MLARSEDCVLVVVDIQDKFLDPIWQKQRVVDRAKFMIECAKLLSVPIIVSEQVPERMGHTVSNLISKSEADFFTKSTFSCWSEAAFRRLINKHKRAQCVLVGIESHICVNQTAHDLMDEDIDVILAADAVSARTEGMHLSALKRMADEGAAIAHSESIVYEWMQDAKHPQFRSVLELVKGMPSVG